MSLHSEYSSRLVLGWRTGSIFGGIVQRQIQNAVSKLGHGLKLSDYYYIGQTEDIPGEAESVKDLKVEKTI